jgi:hypothetical protein
MMVQIGRGMDDNTRLFSTLSKPKDAETRPKILDIGMAPGGFSAAILEKHPSTLVRGLSLPVSQGGYEIRLPNWQTNPNVDIQFLDVTMLAGDMGVDKNHVSPNHPDAGEFLYSDGPFVDESFDIVFCGAQVNHEQPRAEYREGREHVRLWTCQLVTAMQRLRQGGALVVLLNRADSWQTAVMLRTIDSFSRSLVLHKTKGPHAKRSTFYAVARGVDTDSVLARQAVEDWKSDWRTCTLGDKETQHEFFRVAENDVDDLISGFGKRLLQLGAPVWKIQADALERVLEKPDFFKARGWNRNTGQNGSFRRNF